MVVVLLRGDRGAEFWGAACPLVIITDGDVTGAAVLGVVAVVVDAEVDGVVVAAVVGLVVVVAVVHEVALARRKMLFKICELRRGSVNWVVRLL